METGRKPRLLLCGHTYGAGVNLAKPAALSEWFDVMVCASDFTGREYMGRPAELQHGDSKDPRFEFRRFQCWPSNKKFSRCLFKGLGEAFAQWQPEVVLCEAEPWSPLRWQCRLLAFSQKPGAKFFEFTWENVKRPGWKGGILSLVYRVAAMTSHGVICGNKGAERLFLQAGMRPSQILRTGQLGVDPVDHNRPSQESRSSWRKKLNISQEAKVIGFCGRLVEEKGILDLWEAVAAARARCPEIVLVALGGGPLHETLKARLAEAIWFRLLPPVSHEEVPEFLSQLDLFVLPSKPQTDPDKGPLWEEQFGHVLIEGMREGTPCLGSDCGGIPEVLEREDVIFQSGNITSLKELLLHWLADPARLELLRVSQQKRTEQRWRHDVLASQYAEFILNIRNGCTASGFNESSQRRSSFEFRVNDFDRRLE